LWQNSRKHRRRWRAGLACPLLCCSFWLLQGQGRHGQLLLCQRPHLLRLLLLLLLLPGCLWSTALSRLLSLLLILLLLLLCLLLRIIV
jgi:hypothetical protein